MKRKGGVLMHPRVSKNCKFLILEHLYSIIDAPNSQEKNGVYYEIAIRRS